MHTLPLWVPDKDGLFDLDWTRYQTALAANCSGTFFPTPAHMKSYADRLLDQISGKEPLSVKPHFVIGSLTHKFVLEPDEAWKGLRIIPEEVASANWQSDRKQNWYYESALGIPRDKSNPLTTAEFKDRAARSGLTVLTQEDFQEIQAMVEAILAKKCRMTGPDGRVIFDDGLEQLIAMARCEMAAFARREVRMVDELVATKARVDMEVPGNIVLDIKTTAGDATPDDFSRSMWDFKYHARAAFNLDILNALEPVTGVHKDVFLAVVVEKKAPHGVAVFQIDPEAIEAGRQYYHNRLAAWHQAQKTDTWPGHPDQVQMLPLPAWALRKSMA